MELFKLNTPAALRIPQNWLFSELADSVKQSWMKRGTPTSRCQHYHLLPCFPCCPRASFILLPIFLSCCCQYFFPFVVNICFILLPIFVSVANICYCCQYLLLSPIFVSYRCQYLSTIWTGWGIPGWRYTLGQGGRRHDCRGELLHFNPSFSF